MSSSYHHLDLVFEPVNDADLDHLQSSSREDSSAVNSSRGLPARGHTNGVCIGALFALKHRHERHSAASTASGSTPVRQKFVVKGRTFGGGAYSPELEDRPNRGEGRPRKVPVPFLFTSLEKTPRLELPTARGLAPPLAVRQAQGMTKGQEVIQQARLRNSQPWRRAQVEKKEATSS